MGRPVSERQHASSGLTFGLPRRAPFRLAAVVSHPIQYQAPLFRALADCAEIDLHVFFCSRRGVDEYHDAGFGKRLSWDIPLLGGYRYTFLKDLSPLPDRGRIPVVFNPEITTALARGNFDAVWVHGWNPASSWIACATGATLGLPILLRGESDGLAEPLGLKGKLKHTILASFFKRISGFLAIGSNNLRFYQSYGVPVERIFWTPYAVDNSFFLEHATGLEGQKALLREKQGIPADRPVILYCGKLVDVKRPMDLLVAFAGLINDQQASLVFVGDGPLRRSMEQFVAERCLRHVYFLGFRNQTELPPCYAMADVLVLPSGFEPWGLVLNEAMCCGLPVIASDRVGAAADLVQEGVNGFTFPVGDTAALADRLKRVLSNEQAQEEMGEQSRRIIDSWSFREDIAGLLGALHTVAGDEGSKLG